MTLTPPRPEPFTRYPKDRAAIAAGYRHLADLIENGTAPIPLNITTSLSVDTAEAATTLRRALGGGLWEKNESDGGSYLYLTGMCGGLPMQLWMDRDAVCERVVTGTRVVTVTIPVGDDPRPIETVTRTEDVVEWICSPLLAEQVAQ